MAAITPDRRGRIIVLGVMMVTAGCVLGLNLAYGHATRPATAGVFTGNAAHDFGIVQLSQAQEPLEHTFTLRNARSESIEVIHVQSSCGCAQVEATPDIVEPGGTLDVSAVLTLSDSGVKTARVRIHTSHSQEPFTLSLRATGRRSQQLTINRRHVEVKDDSAATVHLQYIDYDNDHAPPGPITTSSSEVEFVAHTWEMVHPGDAAASVPARWRAQLTLRAKFTRSRVVIDLHCGGDTVSLVLLRDENRSAIELPSPDASDAAGAIPAPPEVADIDI